MFAGSLRRRRMVVALVVVAGVGCSDRPSVSQLNAWRSEAIAANKAAMASAKQANQPWTLTILGRTTHGEPTVMAWSDIIKLAVTSIHTRSPQNPAAPLAKVHFRGVRVSDLLIKYGVGPNVEQITFVAHDAFRSTVRLRDAERFPVVLAIEADGQPIPRSSGGPIFLTFPHDDFAETKKNYPDRYWCFYVTHMVVGTMPTQLKIGTKLLSASDLAKLPQTTITQPVHYKVHWPSTAIRLRGVMIRDLFAAANITLESSDSIVAVGLASIHHDSKQPMKFTMPEVDECGVFVATHWGERDTPISARLGGPLAIAISDKCRTKFNTKRWVTMLQELHVVRQSHKK